MSQKEEDLDEKIARIRKQNAAIIERRMMIEAEIEDCQKKNSIVNLKSPITEESDDEGFGPTLYADKLSHEKRVVKPTPEDVWDGKPTTRRNNYRGDKEQEWREERKRIDEERIRRQKANTGSWKREWDADKVSLSEGQDSKSTFKNAGNKDFQNEKSENRGKFYSNESKGNIYQDSENTEMKIQNRWQNDKPARRINPERRTNDYHDHRGPSKNDNRGTNASDSDKFNNNTAKSDLRNRILNSSNSNKSFSVSNIGQHETKNWGLDNMEVRQPLKPKVNNWPASSSDNAKHSEYNKSRANEWRGPPSGHSKTNEYNNQTNEWRGPSVGCSRTNEQTNRASERRSLPGNNLRTNEQNSDANEWRGSSVSYSRANEQNNYSSEWHSLPGNNLKTNEQNNHTNEWRDLSGNNLRNNEHNNQINEWRGPVDDNLKAFEYNKPQLSEWRGPSGGNLKVTVCNEQQTNEWRSFPGSGMKTIEPNESKTTDRSIPSRDQKASELNRPKIDESSTSRPIAVRGNKWNRQDISVKSKPSINLVNRLNRYNKSKNVDLDLDKSTTVPLPNDLKNIVIRVKNSETESDKREVEVLNTPSKPPYPNPYENDNREFEAYENSSGYGSITFERSDLKRSTEHAHYDDLSSQTAIVTQMFSNSTINDNLSNDSKYKTGSLNQIYENSNKDINFVNNQQCLNNEFSNCQQFSNNQFSNCQQFPSVASFVDLTVSPQEVKITRTIKNENLLFPTKSGDKLKKLPYMKNKKVVMKESTQGEQGEEDEWEDASDEWEDVSDEEPA